MDDSKIICENCDSPVNNDDDFCINCGGLFADNVKCENHTGKNAIGVCTICHKTICHSCAGRINDYFLCLEHSHYEIIEGMARIYGTNDFVESEYVLNCLKKADFHPFNYSRKTSPISLGGVDYSLFRASGEYNGHLINEIKIMVPLHEVLPAEKLLVELDIKK